MQILQLLEAAGNSGLRVQDIAEKLGTKAVNIHAWFQNAAKRIPQLKKVGRAQYRLGGAVKASTGAKSGSGEKRKSSGKGKRGELKQRILEQLQAAGKKGVTVREMAAKLGVNSKNLFVWFATTGKKHKAIKKLGEGHYRLAA